MQEGGNTLQDRVIPLEDESEISPEMKDKLSRTVDEMMRHVDAYCKSKLMTTFHGDSDDLDNVKGIIMMNFLVNFVGNTIWHHLKTDDGEDSLQDTLDIYKDFMQTLHAWIKNAVSQKREETND